MGNIAFTRVEVVWTAEMMAKLDAWWRDPKVSIREMADRLNVSRSAVIGKADRMALPHRENFITSRMIHEPPKFAPRSVSIGPPPTKCRFPMWAFGARPNEQFCGAPVLWRERKHLINGSYVQDKMPTPYCADHYGLCYHPPKVIKVPASL